MGEKFKSKENASMSTLTIVENGKVKEWNNCFVIVKETIVTLMKNVIAENTELYSIRVYIKLLFDTIKDD